MSSEPKKHSEYDNIIDIAIGSKSKLLLLFVLTSAHLLLTILLSIIISIPFLYMKHFWLGISLASTVSYVVLDVITWLAARRHGLTGRGWHHLFVLLASFLIVLGYQALFFYFLEYYRSAVFCMGFLFAAGTSLTLKFLG